MRRRTDEPQLGGVSAIDAQTGAFALFVVLTVLIMSEPTGRQQRSANGPPGADPMVQAVFETKSEVGTVLVGEGESECRCEANAGTTQLCAPTSPYERPGPRCELLLSANAPTRDGAHRFRLFARKWPSKQVRVKMFMYEPVAPAGLKCRELMIDGRDRCLGGSVSGAGDGYQLIFDGGAR